MPNRIIREDILTSERVASLDWASEVFYRRLHSIVDDYGRYEAGHQLLRAKCYPLQTDSVRVADIARWMAACQKSGLILVYGANGKQYLEVCDFKQRTRTESKWPPPPSSASICAQMSANDGLGVCVVEGVCEGDKRPADAELFPDVPDQVIRDFKALRKAKKAAITPTAIAGIAREAEKAGVTLAAALAVCCERGWAGFKAEWVTGDKPSAPVRKRKMLDEAPGWDGRAAR